MFYKLKVRQMSAVLLRRIFSSSVDFYEKLDPTLQQGMKDGLLKAIEEEQIPTVRKKICDAVAELSRSLLGELQSSVQTCPAKASGPFLTVPETF